MPSANFSAVEYKTLLSELTTIYQQYLSEGDSDWNKSILYGNWSIGKRISDLEKSLPSHSIYGQEIIKKLSKDLQTNLGKGFSTRNLFNYKKFYKLYPKAKINPILSWSHYSILITINDPKKRTTLEKKAIQKKLSFRDLRALILESNPKSSIESSKDIKPLVIQELILHTYRTITPIPNQPPLLDLGFSVFTSLSLQASQPESFSTTDKPSYTYKAFLKKVVDGDTIEVLIELGFSNYTTQRLRLNSIDTPELPTPEGEKAKKFVETTLQNVKFLIIKTHSHDKYDRYLVDVFFLEGKVTEEDVIRKGRFLNQEILDAGMGWRW